MASISPHGPVGENIVASTRIDRDAGGVKVIKRILPRQNEAVNEIWISDKTRFGHHFTMNPDRLTTPQVRTTGRPVDENNRSADRQKAPEHPLPEKKTLLTERGLIALIPDEIFEALPADDFEDVIARKTGYAGMEQLKFNGGEAGDEAVMDTLSSMVKEQAAFDVLVVQEAWQPPIKESLLFLKTLRRRTCYGTSEGILGR